MYTSRKFAGGFGAVLAAGISLLLLSGESVHTAPRAPAARRISSLPGETAARARLAANWGNLPLRFEENAGQTDSRVQYVARGTGYGVLLSGTRVYFVLDGSRPSRPIPRMRPVERLRAARERAAERVTLRMEMEGANPAPAAEPLDQLATRSNYLIGKDPAQWHTDIANYGRVRYREVYPGVDLIYYGKQKHLEYDFVVAPGRDPGRIRLRFTGADAVEVNGKGELVLRTKGKELREERPVAYQMVGEERREVRANYEVRGDVVQFAVGSYDASRPLTIDPSLTWSTFFGGSGDDSAFAIALDGFGDVFVTGFTNSTGLGTSGSFQPNLNGTLEDAFVLQVDPTGSFVVWSTYLGGTNYDEGDAVAVDATGNVYVGGITVSSNFPGTAGNAQPSYAGLATTSNGFLAKLDPTGSTLMYATYLGGGGPDGVNDITVDGAGNVYATGFTLSGSPGSSPNFPTTAGVVQTAFGGTSGGNTGDAFVTKLSANGKTFLYSTYLGGARDDQGWSIQVDGSGNAYVAGETQSTNFPTTAGVIQPLAPAKMPGASYSGWIAELNPGATALVFSTYLGGRGNDHIFGLARGGAGNLYVTGGTTSNNFPTTSGVVQRIFGGTAGGLGDAFVTKVNPTATAFVYSTYLGGTGDEAGASIKVDAGGFAYVVGFTTSTNFRVTANANQKTLNGAQNTFVTKVRPGATLLIYSSYHGGSGTDTAFRAETDGSSGFFTGSTTSTNFPVTAGVVQTIYGGGPEDAFLASFDLTAPTVNLSPTSLNFGNQTVGTTSPSKPVTLKNIGNAPLTISAFTVTGDFALPSNTCGTLPATLNPGVSCTLNVTFHPTALGTRNGTLKVTDNAPGSPQTVRLTGNGI